MFLLASWVLRKSVCSVIICVSLIEARKREALQIRKYYILVVVLVFLKSLRGINVVVV